MAKAAKKANRPRHRQNRPVDGSRQPNILVIWGDDIGTV